MGLGLPGVKLEGRLVLLHGFAFTKVIATAIRTQLTDLVFKLRELAGADEQIETGREVFTLVAVTEMERILAMLRLHHEAMNW